MRQALHSPLIFGLSGGEWAALAGRLANQAIGKFFGASRA